MRFSSLEVSDGRCLSNTTIHIQLIVNREAFAQKISVLTDFFQTVAQIVKPRHTRSKCLHKHLGCANLFDVYGGSYII